MNKKICFTARFTGVILISLALFGCGAIETETAGQNSALARTGQTNCYDKFGFNTICAETGQDGEYRAGAEWPSPRFTDKKDGTIVDRLTGLMWIKDANIVGGAIRWEDAASYIKTFRGMYGYNDWRIPTANELESLIDAGQIYPAVSTDHLFANIASGGYWSSTSLSNSNEIINLATGEIFVDTRKGQYSYYYILPVRTYSGGTIKTFKTGQANCYNQDGLAISCIGTEQDGERQAGNSWPAPRFTDNGKGAVSDNMTGLAWTKSAHPAGISVNWEEAFQVINQMNSGERHNFGHSDWRLPNRRELWSMLDWSGGAPSIPGIFNDRGGVYYWSSTSEEDDPSRAWQVSFGIFGGEIISDSKTGTAIVWPVRSIN